MNYHKASQKLKNLDETMEEQVSGCLVHSTEIMIYTQTKAILVALQAMIHEKAREQDERQQ